MTAHLHVVDGQPEPTVTRGSADLEDAFYFHRSQIDSPPTDGIYRTDFNCEGGGVVHVYFATDLAFARWSRYLGFDIRQEPKGQALLSEAAGTVPFRGEDYAVICHYTRYRDSGDIA